MPDDFAAIRGIRSEEGEHVLGEWMPCMCLRLHHREAPPFCRPGMIPIFNRRGKTVGWIANGLIFNQANQLRAFIRNDAIFSFESAHCLGWLEAGFLRDRNGDAVAFLSGAREGPPVPIPEIPPLAPILAIPRFIPVPSGTPTRPVASREWSSVEWYQFMS